MATRKKTTRSARRSSAARSGGARSSTVRPSTRNAASARGAAKGRTGKSAAKQRRKVPAKGPAARQTASRQRKSVEEVTEDIQRRWDLEEEDVPTPPSTLDLDRRASAAASGRAQMKQRQLKHTAASPTITGGDIDADWEQAYFAGDESATADNPTPDQSEVEDVGKAVGLEYEDAEELKSTPKVDKRDKNRWELDPASSEDYKERNRGKS